MKDHERSPLSPMATAGPAEPATVLIVDDDRILCELLRDRINDEQGLACSGIATTSDEARCLTRDARPHVILVDVRLGWQVDAIALAGTLIDISPRSQVLIWTGWSDPSPDRTLEIRQKVRAMAIGATDWISKGNGIDNLIDRTRMAVGRGPSSSGVNRSRSPIELSLGELLDHPAFITDHLDGASRQGDLTPAERRVSGIVARGLEQDMTIEQIARTTGMNTKTLRAQIKSVYQKWGVHGQASFVAEARRRGLR